MSRTLIRHAPRLLFSPATEWEAIEKEPANLRDIYLFYVVPLVAFSAACALFGTLYYGIGLLRTPTPLGTLVSDVLLTSLLQLLMVFVFALMLDALAPVFHARRNFAHAFKVAAYAPTAAWIGGIFLLFPPLAPVSLIAALYSLYLLFTGLPRLMKPKASQTVPYTVISIIVGVGLFLVVSWLLIAMRFF
jgi:hypothetical protein